jgi:hypothetical protein
MWEVEGAGVCQPQCPVVFKRLWGRYGGRAERGMKKVLCGMVAIGCTPRTDRDRYPGEVSGPADEDICYLLGRSGKEK